MPRIVLKEQDSDKALEVSGTEASIGRDPACGFFVQGTNSKVVSGRHARIFYQDNAWWIEDTSRNGTILDEERLQQGQRHAVEVGQLIGLGESGPRYRVTALESRPVADTVTEAPPSTQTSQDGSSAAAPPSPSAAGSHRPPVLPPANLAEVRSAALRQSEAQRSAQRSAQRIEEATEPMAPSPDWLVHVVLRATSTDERYEVRSHVVRLGRSPECNVQIPPEQGASVSRIHAEISIRDGGVTLRDMGSRNGTFVNGRRVDVTAGVVKNDLLMLGSGGPTFAIDDLHIVKAIGPGRPPESQSAGAPEHTEAAPPQARSPFEGSPALSRHTSYRNEPPTAPSSKSYRNEPPTAPSPKSRRSPMTGDALFSKNVLEDVPAKSAKRARILIWAGVVTILVLAGLLLR